MTSNAPTFNQVASLALYELSSTGDAGVAGYWAGYRPSAAASFGPVATLDQVWQDVGGVYIFLNETPSDFAAFLAAFDALLPKLSPTGAVRFVWIANPNDSSGYWQINILLARSSGSGPTISWTVLREASFPLGNYAVMVESGAALSQANAATLGYGVAVDASKVIFIGPGGSFQPDSGSAWLPLAGSSVGAWAATLSLPGGEGTHETVSDGLVALDVQLRYALPSPDDPTGDSVTAIPMPMLRQDGAAVKLYLSFDPLNMLNTGRTQLAFFAPGGADNPPALGSAFVTTRGYATTLTPLSPPQPLWGARLVFCFNPLFVTAKEGVSYSDYYLTPDGAFSLATKTPEPLLTPTAGGIADRVTLGLSGLEYVGLSAASGAIAFFRSGQPAFAPNALAGAASAQRTGDAPSLTDLATTSYVAFLPSEPEQTGLTYFAQPRQAPLFVAGTDLGEGFMDFHEMPAADLGSYASGGPTPTALPVGVYTGINPLLGNIARLLEQAALAPARRAAITLPKSAEAVPGEGGDQPLAVTPQGLVAELSADRTRWAGIVLANMPNSRHQQLAFTQVGPALQAALQSNELFFVVSNVETFMKQSSVSYRISAGDKPFLLAAGVPNNVADAVMTLLGAMDPPFPVFANETRFVETISPVAGEYVEKILPVAGLLKADINGWTFQLSPRSWRTDPDSPTVMIFKYCNRSLEEMLADASAWGWPAAARDKSGDLQPTQRLIQKFMTAAAKAAPDTPYARFYREIVIDPSWNGILFLNAPVSVSEFPDDLQFLAAGIDVDKFYAHHVGFALTPFKSAMGTIVLGQTAVFGLIDYRDPLDLFLSSTVPFAFKTLALTARFANAALADFSAQVELMVNILFGAELTKLNPERGNNLVFNGSYQQQNNSPSYAFTLEGENVYSPARAALVSVEVLGAQLQTATGTAGQAVASVKFVLSGNLGFIELERFDLFSYGEETIVPEGREPAEGRLRFGNLIVEMSFPLAFPKEQSFVVKTAGLSFDMSNSEARPLSLAANFPVRVTGFVESANVAPPGEPPQGQRPEDLGFTLIVAPIDQSLLSPPWFGLVMTLDLGTLGALVGSAGLSVTLLAGWATGMTEDERPIYLGLKVAAGKAAGINWPIQGVFRLGFRSFQFQAEDNDEGGRDYMLRLRRLALSILGWSFPPGSTDVFLFGLGEEGGKSALGWYAAYAADEKKTQKTQLALDGATEEPQSRIERRLRSGRRLP